MKETVIKNIHQMLSILDDTKREIANGISEDIMNGIYVVSEENQSLLKFIGRMTDDLKAVLGSDFEYVNSKAPEAPIKKEAPVAPTVQEPVKPVEVPKPQPVPTPVQKVQTPIEEPVKPVEESVEYEPAQDWFDNNDSPDFNEEDFIKDFSNTISDDVYEGEATAAQTEEPIRENTSVEEAAPEVPKTQAEVIGEVTTEDENLPFYGRVMNERQKKSGDFIFNKYRIAASKVGFNAASDITIYVAPLQVIPNNPNVPIIVHLYSHGNFKTASSYDTKDSGHNIVTIEIDNFYLLIRGGFDSNGKFVSYVMTTGLSANQGDIVNILSKEEGYTGPIMSGCGHIKFEEDGNVYELFPLNLQENEYLCILISKEFLDYYVVAKNYGSPKIRIFENGTQKEIIAGWSGDVFEADIL